MKIGLRLRIYTSSRGKFCKKNITFSKFHSRYFCAHSLHRLKLVLPKDLNALQTLITVSVFGLWFGFQSMTINFVHRILLAVQIFTKFALSSNVFMKLLINHIRLLEIELQVCSDINVDIDETLVDASCGRSYLGEILFISRKKKYLKTISFEIKKDQAVVGWRSGK